jgi:hypothetical protein
MNETMSPDPFDPVRGVLGIDLGGSWKKSRRFEYRYGSDLDF